MMGTEDPELEWEGMGLILVLSSWGWGCRTARQTWMVL